MLNYLGQPIMRSADRLDPHEMIAKGKELRQQMASSPVSTPEASAAMFVEAGVSLYNFRFAGPWDAQRRDDKHSDPALVDYANELIEMYAKAAGLPVEVALEAANVHNLEKVTLGGAAQTTSPTQGYSYLSVRDTENLRIGYNSVTDDGKIVYQGPKSVHPDD